MFRFNRGLPYVLTALPVVATIAYVLVFATPTPLTDENVLLRAAIRRQEAQFASWTDVIASFDIRIVNHPLAVPFALYAALAPLVNFDSRAFVCVTLLAFGLHLLIFRSLLRGAAIALVPVALVLFSPAHFMEFHWGFQFTIALSVLFSALGLWQIDRSLPPDEPVRWPLFGLGLLFFVLGALSSAGAVLAPPAAALLVALKRRRLVREVLPALLLLAITAVIATRIVDVGVSNVTLTEREVLYVLTAFGATVWGMPVGATKFQVDHLSITGFLICAVMAIALVRAFVLRAYSGIALCAALFCLSGALLASVAMNRPYLGNWHLQMALPGVCAAYAAALLLFRKERSRGAIALVVATTLLTTLPTLFAYYRGFTQFGPDYRRYIAAIEVYTLRYLEQPDQRKPFPGGLPHDTDAEMVLFLAARNHALFRPTNAAIMQAAVKGRLHIDPPVFSKGDATDGRRIMVDHRHTRIVAVLQQAAPNGVVMNSGPRFRVMHRIHPTLSGVAACQTGACYAGWFLAGELLPGWQPIEISLVQ